MFFPHAVIPPPSSRARELSRALTDTIRAFQRRNPGLSEREVRQALWVLSRECGSGRSQQTFAIVLFLGVLLFSVIMMLSSHF